MNKSEGSLPTPMDDVERRIVEMIRFIGVKAGVAETTYGAMCHEARSILRSVHLDYDLSKHSEIGRIEMPKDYPPQHANADGWTDWISPTDIDMYGLQCCDCGLKHEMQFRVMRNKAYTDGEHWFADPVPVEEGYHVAFRMKRDAESVSTGVQSATTSISVRWIDDAVEFIRSFKPKNLDRDLNAKRDALLSEVPVTSDSPATAQITDTMRLDYLEKTLHIDGTVDEPIMSLFIPGSEASVHEDWGLRRYIDESMKIDAADRHLDKNVPSTKILKNDSTGDKNA